MGFRYDMRGKSQQQQAIVRKRDEADKKRKQENTKEVGTSKTNKETPINETKYCKIWERSQIDLDSGGVAVIELITVKELNRDEIRFAYYKREENGTLRLVPRPLDLTHSDLNRLLKAAREAKIIEG